MIKPKQPSILCMSTFPPRECGIATFAQDLTNAIDKEFSPDVKSKILAINDNGTSIYNYPQKVIMQINETEMEDYINRANEINKLPHIKMVNIQHEYGIFGGDWGDYILPFLELLQKPAILTMHTVLPEPPDKNIKSVTQAMARKVAAIIVMTQTSANYLIDVYGIDKKKIHVIPHGVHNVAYPSKTKAKTKLKLDGRLVFSTFGMLNRDKGIEYAIEALPKIIKEHPNALYLILGATHPVIRRDEGERYRNKLKRIIYKLGLKENVKFYNKYLTLEELIDYLKATDIYISPTLNPLQAVSGTISYALSCACPIVATKNQYASDVINEERGQLVKFENSKEIEKALLYILRNEKRRKEMGKNSYFYSRHMTWQNVALSYFNIFNEFAKIIPKTKGVLPEIKLDYIKNLSNNFSIIQFANHTKPDLHSGYCLDDNARAMLGCADLYEETKDKQALNLVKIYLKFTKFVQKDDGKFHNFVTYRKTYNDNGESEDAFGRCIWSLGHVVNSHKLPINLTNDAYDIFEKTENHFTKLHSLRAISFSILGLTKIYKTKKSKKIENLIKKLSNKLVKIFNEQVELTKNKWLWFEDCFTYSNYKLPEALFRAYEVTDEKKYLNIAKKSIDFLDSITFENKKYFSPIGQDGWYFRNGKRSYFDQQPEDASSAVEALVAAFQVTKNKTYKDKANLAFEWFLGKNHLNQMVYDEATGGCFDGLGKYSLNFNQGAESTLAYFLARLAIEKIK
ncbi:glycosyltransferase [Candidatus Parcubacteria bacterium]|nr:glycosyltransferase [Candidatus Parcubacteria bacterium]